MPNLSDRVRELMQELYYLEADDQAYNKGFGPHIERTRTALYEARHQLEELMTHAVQP